MNLVKFNFGNSVVRSFEKENQIWFVVNDIAKALSYSNPRDAIKKHVHMEDVAKCDTPINGIVQTLSIVNESGMYSLVLRSKKKEALAFKRWVTGEVLPTIRKTGAYINKINSKQQFQIREAVINFHRNTGKAYGLIYHELYKKFQIAKYQDLPSDKINQALSFLNCREINPKVQVNKLAMINLSRDINKVNSNYSKVKELFANVNQILEEMNLDVRMLHNQAENLKEMLSR